MANLTGLPEALSDSRHKLRNAHLVFATNRETKTLRDEIRLKQACGRCCGKRFLKGLPKQGGMIMIDALAIALATVAMGIPAIMTAAALGSKLGLHW